jgi:hypothetical protein
MAMKHARRENLADIEDILKQLRKRAIAKEKSPGVFYLKGRAWLHFHEDSEGLYADVRPDSAWIRVCVSNPDGRQRLLELLNDVL